MGYMKRIIGWRQAGWPIPQPIQAFVGLVPFRDPEAYAEKKRAEKEAQAERAAIQAEAREAKATIAEVERPRLAAAAWYRVDSTFYRITEGPYPTFGLMSLRAIEARTREPVARGKEVQGSLFDGPQSNLIHG